MDSGVPQAFTPPHDVGDGGVFLPGNQLGAHQVRPSLSPLRVEIGATSPVGQTLWLPIGVTGVGYLPVMAPPLIQSYQDFSPQIDSTAFVHPAAVLIGEVFIGARANIWPGVVLRGDQGAIHIGAETNLQDGTIAHATGGLSTTQIGAKVTVGHRVLLHGCIVEDRCLIGMGAILMDNCRIGSEALIGAGALVPPGKIIPPRSLVLRSPGVVVRTLSDEDVERLVMHGHREYLKLAAEYMEQR